MTKGRRLTVVFLSIVFFFITQIPGSRSSAASNTDFQMDNSTLVKYTGTASNVSIPSNVKIIGREAFAENTGITAVSIGENVREIEQGAFRDCTGLTAVFMPDSLEEINSGAFSNCTSLKRVSMGEGLKTIGSGIFAGCSSLSTVSVDRNNPYLVVSDNALYSKDKTILYSYFGGNGAVRYEMPSTVTNIVDYAFWGNDTLEEVYLSTSLREISGYAFSNCKALTNMDIPYSVRSIDTRAFENCISLKNISIPASVAYIHSTAFDGCFVLDFEVAEGTVGYEFYQDWKRNNRGKMVETKTTTTTVSGNDNANTANLAATNANEGGNIFVVGGNHQISTVNKTANTNGQNTAAANDGQSQSTGYSADTYNALNHPSNVDYIPQQDPLENKGEGVVGQTIVVGQTAVILMDSSPVVNSGNTPGAVSGNGQSGNDKGISLPEQAIVGNKISDYAYYRSTELADYEVSAAITDIGEFSFARSTLTSVTIPEGVKEIGYAAFYHCDHLTKVNIPSTVTWIGPSAFHYTPWLVNWGNDRSAEDYLIVGDGILLAYKGNSQTVEIPTRVKTIAPAVFAGHDEIQSVTLPSSVKVIGEKAFQNCSSLSTVNGGEGLEEVQTGAFQDTALTNETMPASMRRLGVQ